MKTMKTVTGILAAALIAGGSSLALAQSDAGGGGASAGGAGGDIATPRKNQARPSGPVVNKRDDDMAPLNSPTNTRQSSGSFDRRAGSSQNWGGNNWGNGNNGRY
jgi:hypothetical protein